jgi:hypothetical protein
LLRSDDCRLSLELKMVNGAAAELRNDLSQIPVVGNQRHAVAVSAIQDISYLPAPTLFPGVKRSQPFEHLLVSSAAAVEAPLPNRPLNVKCHARRKRHLKMTIISFRITGRARLAPAALQMSNSALTLRLGLGGLVDDFDPSVLRGEHVAFVLRSLLSIADGMEICGR